jgi:hypothetical protein
MRLLPTQADEASFLSFGREAVSLLERRDFGALADRFGYALAAGRSPLAAIEGDYQSCLTEYAALEPSPSVAPSLSVKFFEPNSANLYALVECVFTTSEGCPILAELIVTSAGEDKHVTLEQISPLR